MNPYYQRKDTMKFVINLFNAVLITMILIVIAFAYAISTGHMTIVDGCVDAANTICFVTPKK